MRAGAARILLDTHQVGLSREGQGKCMFTLPRLCPIKKSQEKRGFLRFHY
jgi:hypothetical protein